MEEYEIKIETNDGVNDLSALVAKWAPVEHDGSVDLEKTVDDYIDFLCNFVRPSMLRRLVKKAKDKGNYENLCDNLAYIDRVMDRAKSVSDGLYDNLAEIVWGKHESGSNGASLIPFPSNNLSMRSFDVLFMDEEWFVGWFEDTLRDRDDTVYSLLYDRSMYEHAKSKANKIRLNDAIQRVADRCDALKGDLYVLNECMVKMQDVTEKLDETTCDNLHYMNERIDELTKMLVKGH